MTRSLKAGVIGVGYLGALHAAKYRELAGVELVGVHDIDRDRAREVAAAEGCPACPSAEDLCARADLVSIAVPTADHLAAGRIAADHGVAMLVEKPLAADPSAARELVRAAEQSGVTVQVGHLERFNKVFREVRDLIGAPRFIECDRLSPFAGRGADTNVVYDVMIHDLDLIDYLVGTPVAAVEAVGVPVLSVRTDIANARLRFEGGCVANVTASRVSLKRERKLRIFQTDAYVSIDFDAGSVLLAHKRERTSTSATGSPMDSVEVERRDVGAGDALLEEIRDFVRCVRDGAPPLVGPREALRAMETAERVVRSIESGAADLA